MNPYFGPCSSERLPSLESGKMPNSAGLSEKHGFRIAIAILLTATVALCASTPERLNPDTESAFDNASSLQIEMAADLLLQVIAAGKVPKRKAVTYLEGLYHRAGEAGQSHALRLVPRQLQTSKSDQFAPTLAEAGLDSANLRVRVLKRLAGLDATAVNRLLAILPADPIAASASCAEIAVPYRGDFYFPNLFTLFRDDQVTIARFISSPQDVAAVLTALPTGADIMPLVVLKMKSVLETAPMSDRVFVATELSLRIGKRIEDGIAGGRVPPTIQAELANAYVGYVRRQTRGDLCSDRPQGRNGEDITLNTALASIDRLSSRLSIPRLDLGHTPSKYSTTSARGGSSLIQQDLANLIVLATKLRNGGVDAVRAQFITELDSYVKKGLEDSDPGSTYDIAGRAGALVMLIAKFDFPEVTSIAVPELFRVMDRSRLRELQPTAWILLMREVLNLTMHPNADVSLAIRAELDRSTDRDVAAYWSLQKRAGLVIRYSPDPLGMTVVGPY